MLDGREQVLSTLPGSTNSVFDIPVSSVTKNHRRLRATAGPCSGKVQFPSEIRSDDQSQLPFQRLCIRSSVPRMLAKRDGNDLQEPRSHRGRGATRTTPSDPISGEF